MRSIIVEGIDRLGKDTLVEGLQDELGYFQVIHYQKPEKLRTYINAAASSMHVDLKKDTFLKSDLEVVDRIALERYQRASFETMFHLLNSEAPLLLNRAHLGEAVYAPLYRGYPGTYVFDMELDACDISEEYYEGRQGFQYQTLLVLLKASDFDPITDDGLSFNSSAKLREQKLFEDAFGMSKIRKKLLIDVTYSHEGKGRFVPREKILDAVISAFSSSADEFTQKVWWGLGLNGILSSTVVR